MQEDLKILISYVNQKYEEMDFMWRNSELYSPLNLRKLIVKDIYTDKNILDLIFHYRIFLNNNNLDLSLDFKNLAITSVVNTRVKAQNSIEYKINNYIKNHNNGEEPINKCFNDLYGIRIILNESVSYDNTKSFLAQNYPNMKCIDSSKKEGYVATHIYFKKDNYNFPWELQVWDKEHEKSNIRCHEKYKQDYTKWEKES